MLVLETERLVLRHMSLDDAAFIVDLLTDPEFMRFVGDRGVKTIEDARHYIATGPLASYESHGFGLFIVEQKGSGLPVGICGRSEERRVGKEC